MNKFDELVDKEAISKLKSFVRQYGIVKRGDYSSQYVRIIKVETSDCIIKFCVWLSGDAHMFAVRFDSHDYIMFSDSFSEYYLSEENMEYYNKKMNYDAIIVCAKSNMSASTKAEFISVAMALFDTSGQFTKKAR